MEFTLTEKAKIELNEMKNDNKPIKLKITGYSWCGATFGIVSEKQTEIEKVYNVEGIDIIVSDDLDGILKGAKIDFGGLLFKDFIVSPKFA